MMKEYEELVQLVAGMESTSPKPTVNYVKMDIGAGEPLSIESPRGFSQLLAVVAQVDSGQSSPKRQQKMQPIMQQPKLPLPHKTKQQPTAKAQPETVSAAPSKGWPIPGLHRQTQPQQAPAPVMPPSLPPFRQRQWRATAAPPAPSAVAPSVPLQSKPLEVSAGEELTRVMKAASVPQPPTIQPVQVKSTKNLVLPRLSLTDQVSELSKIVENLRADRFDSEQMAIVKEEVEGLSESLASERQVNPPAPFEQDLINLRRERLAEALALITLIKRS
jgi:hypothetical protein